MEQFTPEQCQAVALQYQQLPSAVLHRRHFFIDIGTPAGDPALTELQSQQNSLGDISSEDALRAARLTVDNAQQAAARISRSLQSAMDSMHTVDKIDKAISIASDAINLSVAIYTGNFEQIASAAKSLEEASL